MIVRATTPGQDAADEADLRARRGALRVGLLADTHGVLDARVADCLAGCDAIVHAGDVGSDAVLEGLAGASPVLLAVRGNNDTPEKWRGDGAPRMLPLVARLRLPGGDLVAEHGDAHPACTRHQRLRAAHAHARAVVYGHSHRLLQDRACSPWLLNPGAAGRARTYGGPSCLLLAVEGARWRVRAHRFEAVPAARRRPGPGR